MKVEIITTGTELLLGDILNTNVQYLSRKLNALGFDVLYHTTIGDNPDRMKAALRLAAERADIIITSGGLGPTRGDITKEMVAEICGLELYLDLDSWGRIDAFFRERGMLMTDNNEKQAYIPMGADVLTNEVGTAPGLWLDHDGKVFILLPGPPFELTHMCEHELFPRMLERFAQQGIILSRVLHLRGAGESYLADRLDDIIVTQTNPTLALYARQGEIIIRLTAKAENGDAANVLLDDMENQVRSRVGQYVYGVDDESLASSLGKKLLEQGKTIAFAESCTGGLASSLVTDVPGSSEYLLGSVVSYTNQIKHKLLGVQEDTLHQFGAVSRETACEMAAGVKKAIGSDIGVAITGNAGPSASEGKPVGLVYIAVALDDAIYCQEHHFTGTRESNKMRAAKTALSMAIDKLMDVSEE